MKRVAWAALALLAGVSPAGAQGPVQLDRFDQIELRGGGHVTLRQGAEQRVTMVRGDSSLTSFRVDRDRRLVIDACIRTCSRYDLEIEIVVPELDAAAVHGGGAIRAEGGFAPRSLALAVHGGGLLDFRAVNAPSVAAAVHGGGAIRTRARDDLAASVNGGGSITYWGNPQVAQAVHGGGSIGRGQSN